MRRRCAELDELEACAQGILWRCRQCARISGPRLLLPAERQTGFAKREPGRRPIRRKLQGLGQKLMRGESIATGHVIGGMRETAVGDHIARRKKQGSMARWFVVHLNAVQ